MYGLNGWTIHNHIPCAVILSGLLGRMRAPNADTLLQLDYLMSHCHNTTTQLNYHVQCTDTLPLDWIKLVTLSFLLPAPSQLCLACCTTSMCSHCLHHSSCHAGTNMLNMQPAYQLFQYMVVYGLHCQGLRHVCVTEDQYETWA